MEHVYKIKVKRQFDSRSQYPSERRYSASTVFGFAWVHLALACTAFLLACLALFNPGSVQETSLNVNSFNTSQSSDEVTTVVNEFDNANSFENLTPNEQRQESKRVSEQDLPDHLRRDTSNEYSVTLVISPCLIAVGGFAAGFAAIVASKRWYLDHSITWFLVSSIFATITSVVALCMIAVWIASINEYGSHFCDYFSDENLFRKTHFEIDDADDDSGGNKTHYYVIKIPLEELRSRNIPLLGEEAKSNQTRMVLSINILIAAFVEVIWCLLSLKIAWCGMMANYPDDDNLHNRGNGNTVHVVTELKGNNTKHLPKNTKILPPKPDLIEHYPKDSKIKRFFEAQQENGGFFLHTNENENGFMVVGGTNEKPSGFSKRESSAEYRERMLNFLNKCTPNGEADSPEVNLGTDPSSLSMSDMGSNTNEQSDTVSVVKRENGETIANNPNRLSTISWGDRPEYPVFTQNTLDLDKIVLCVPKTNTKVEDDNRTDASNSENIDQAHNAVSNDTDKAES